MIIYLPELSGCGGIDHFKFQTWIINSIPIFSNIHQWSGHNQNYVALRISYQYRCLGQPSVIISPSYICHHLVQQLFLLRTRTCCQNCIWSLLGSRSDHSCSKLRLGKDNSQLCNRFPHLDTRPHQDIWYSSMWHSSMRAPSWTQRLFLLLSCMSRN